MNFLAPALLIGLLAAAIPPIIHLLFRRKPKVVRFPALEFIRRAHKKTVRKFRLRQLLLMAVRSLLLGLVAFALARPFWQTSTAPTAALAGAAQGTLVLVVDASWPMAYRLGDQTLLDRARFQVENLLDQFNGQAAIIFAGERITVPVGEPTSDFTAIRRAVEELKTSHSVGTLSAAVTRAYDLVDEAPGTRRVVVLTSAAGAASALPQPPSSGEIELIPVDVAQGDPVPNRGILSVRLQPAPQLGVGQWRVEARVANYSSTALKRLPIHLEVDGQVQVRGFLTLAPGEEGTKTFFTRLDAQKATPAAVVLEGDALPEDDIRRFWLQPAPKVRILAVNGDPRPTPYLDELFYFERALSPKTAAGARMELTIAAADTFATHDLSDFDVLVLANLDRLDAAPAAAIDGFVRGGGGLLITMGDRIKPSVLNTRLGTVLPRTLRDVRTAGDAAALNEGGDRRKAKLSDFERSHPILKPFSDPSAALGRAKIGKYMLLDPAADASGTVVMSVDDGAPYLLTRTVGRGRVVLLTGSLDRDWGDLPIRPAFLPLLQQTIRHLTRVADLDTEPVLVGQPAPIPVEDPRVQRVQVKSPDGALHTAERPADPVVPWVFNKTEKPGYYQVEPDPPLPGLVSLPGFAVAVDPRGSDLRGPQVKVALGTEAELVKSALTEDKRTELWHAALFGLFMLLVAEGGLLYRRSRREEAV